MKILVLGGNGFFGKSLVKAFNNSDHEVVALSRKNGIDLTDYNLTEKSFQTVQPDIIYNCAAHVGGLHYVSNLHATIAHDNILMSLNIYKAAQEVKRALRDAN
jgi:GDP-L-fucose synthase